VQEQNRRENGHRHAFRRLYKVAEAPTAWVEQNTRGECIAPISTGQGQRDRPGADAEPEAADAGRIDPRVVRERRGRACHEVRGLALSGKRLWHAIGRIGAELDLEDDETGFGEPGDVAVAARIDAKSIVHDHHRWRAGCAGCGRVHESRHAIRAVEDLKRPGRLGRHGHGGH
jgi:hypothetical protein